MKKNNSNSQTNSDRAGKPGKARGPVQRDAKEVVAELVARLTQKLEPRSAGARAGEGRQQDLPGPNRDRLTVGVDLGDKWSNFCIVGLDGEKLTEGELRTTQQDFAELFQSLAAARVVMEVGTHSAWARDVVTGCGHEVLVANPRQMEGPKRRKRKNDRIDAHKLARIGRSRSHTSSINRFVLTGFSVPFIAPNASVPSLPASRASPVSAEEKS
jgi:hypothetical protein